MSNDAARTEALTTLAETFDAARKQADAIADTAWQLGAYGDASHGIHKVLALLLHNTAAEDTAYQAILDGSTVREALVIAAASITATRPMPTPASPVILAPNEGNIIQHAYLTVTATSKQDAIMVALDLLDAHAEAHGLVVSIETYETTQLPTGQYFVTTS
jgi:hypothetical protein